MEFKCRACDAPVHDTFVCKRCERRTFHHLADQASHRAELEVALTRMVQMQAQNDGGRSTPASVMWANMGERFLDTIQGKEIRELIATLPPARKAADALHSQKSLLVSWVRLMREAYPELPGPYCRYCSHESCGQIRSRVLPADNITSLSIYLGHWMPQLRRHEAAGEFVTELQDLVDSIMLVIDTPENRTRILVGPCPETIDEGGGQQSPCPGEVEAIVPRDETKRPKMACKFCKAEWMAEQWLRTGNRILRKQGRAPAMDPEAAKEFLARVAS